MSQLSLVLLPGDIFGLLALFFIGFTAVLMIARKKILRYTKNLDLLRKVHIYASTLGGLFLVLHVAYFISYPITDPILIGYVSAAVAGVVWLTGTAFLERFRDTLFYHSSLSLSAVSLMVVHAASAGINIPIDFAYAAITLTIAVVLYKASQHTRKILKASEVLTKRSR